MKLFGYNIQRDKAVQVPEQEPEPEKRSGNTLDDLSPELLSAFGIVPGQVSANLTTAQRLSAVYQATRLISQDVAGLPLSVYQKDATGTIKQVSSVLSHLLKVEIDPVTRTTPFKFFSTTLKYLQLRGNSYGLIHRDKRSRTLLRIEFIKASDVTIYINDSTGEPLYRINGKTGSSNGYFTSSEILHFKGLGDDTYQGISVLRYAAQGLGIELAAQEMETSFYQNGSIVRDYISFPNSLSDEGFKNVKEHWGNNHKGSKAAKIAILESGGKYETVDIKAEDFQFITRHGKSISEISRWFNVPPDKLFSRETMTYASMEQSSANYALQSMAPWCKNIEQELNIKLCDVVNGEYTKFNLNALIRADVSAQADALVKLTQGGIYKPNESRNLYELNNVDGADELLFPLNAIPQSKVEPYYDAKIAGMAKGLTTQDPNQDAK